MTTGGRVGARRQLPAQRTVPLAWQLTADGQYDMTGILLSKGTYASYRDSLTAAAREAGIEPRIVHLPDDPGAQLVPGDCAAIEVAYYTRDIRFSPLNDSFIAAVGAATNLKWVHFITAAIEHFPFVTALLQRGVRLTTSAGSNGEPVAQTALGGLLMLARGFPRWWAAQGRREWAPMRGETAPRDLAGQTVLIIGLGTIGATLARFCHALGMRVIGMRRTPGPVEAVDEVHAPATLPDLLPRCEWVILACPLTPETQRLVDSAALARLPRGACLINVARGGVVDQPALIAALASGQLGGAYLDVFEEEPLPAASPLWALPNVIISPHNASSSGGNNDRAARIFLANLVKWARGEPLRNEVTEN
jgi:phosphoglycerate dehydrogenase-like enzyme